MQGCLVKSFLAGVVAVATIEQGEGRKLPNTNSDLADIQELNLSYLLLAQNLLRKDREVAIFRLKLSENLSLIHI